MATLTGKIEKLALSYEAPKSSGGTFTAHAIKLEGHEAVVFSANSAAGKYALKLDLKVGDEITIETEKKGNFESVIKVQKKDFKPAGGFGGGGFKKGGFTPRDSTGQIQGMVLKAAIDASLKHDKEFTAENIAKQADIVLAAKALVDPKVKAALPKTTETKAFDPFAETGATKPPSADFANGDGEQSPF